MNLKLHDSGFSKNPGLSLFVRVLKINIRKTTPIFLMEVRSIVGMIYGLRLLGRRLLGVIFWTGEKLA